MYKDNVLVHFLNEMYQKDEKILIKSIRFAKFGTNTLEKIYRKTSSSVNSIAGLKNLGNTWYMNAILQCLMYTPLLKSFFITDQYKQFTHPKTSTLVIELANLFKDADK